MFAPAYLAFRGFALFHTPVEVIATQALYEGILVSVFGLFFFSKAISLLGAAPGAMFAALVPVLATVEAQFLLGEHLPNLLKAGILLVALGMIVSVLGPQE